MSSPLVQLTILLVARNKIKDVVNGVAANRADRTGFEHAEIKTVAPGDEWRVAVLYGAAAPQRRCRRPRPRSSCPCASLSFSQMPPGGPSLDRHFRTEPFFHPRP